MLPVMGAENKKIQSFVASNKNEDLQTYDEILNYFLNDNLNCCYGRPESIYKVDDQYTQPCLIH